MKQLRINLFGNLSIRYDQKSIIDCASSKALELFCYILLNRDRPHTREALASRLWGDHYTTGQAKKYLRKALWQLQSALNEGVGPADDLVLDVNPNAILLNATDELWLDVRVFEEAYARARGVSGASLSEASVQVLEEAVQLYRGNLLDGWYHDWCVCERERLQQMYLIMLDKLLDYCEATGKYELGLVYGEYSLRYDRARECTHRQVMRLFYLRGDRTSAIRHYKSCVAALKEELDLEPSLLTKKLYDLLCEDCAEDIAAFSATQRLDADQPGPQVLRRLEAIHGLQLQLASIQARIQQEMKAIQRLIHKGFSL